MRNLKKVEFYLNNYPELGMFDTDEKEQKKIIEKTKLRIEFSHDFGNEIIEKDDNHYQKTNAIIEYEDLGKVHHISSNNIQFISDGKKIN